MQVLVRDNNVDQALRALKKKMQREGIFREMKVRRHYEKPSERRARERAEAIRRVCNRKASTDLGRCWSDEAGRKQDPKFEARINLTITVSREGSATEVKVLNPSSENRTLEQCVVDSAKSWTYPSGQTEVPVQCGFYLRPGV